MRGSQRTAALLLDGNSTSAPRRFRGAEGRTVRLLAHWTSLLLLASIAWFVVLVQRDVRAGAFDRIDTTRSRLDHGPGWVDPRWEQEIAWSLAAFEDVDPEDRAGVEAIAASLADLSFVERVGDATVSWPDGLRIRVRLREPVACIQVGRQYLTVAADGTVLSGRWSAPPACGSGWLPLVRRPPGEDAAPQPGEVLRGPVVEDGLAVAASLWEQMDARHLARLGRIAIDTLHSREATADDPGCVLYLEERRVVYFGRTPNLDEPGETPVPIKWASLSTALDRLEDAGGEAVDWDFTDVRWDHPQIELRGAAEAEPR